VQLSPITDADIPAVAAFLHHHLNQRVPSEAWASALRVPWKVDAPNHGYMLRVGEAVVGAYLAFYSERLIDGAPERFCNLGAWCVLPEHRFHGLRLLKALLAQEGYHFTDLSPSGNVPAINQRLEFQHLDTTTALVPNLPWPLWPDRRYAITTDPAAIEEILSGSDLDIYRDHAGAAAARHAVLSNGDRWCYVIFRKDRRKRLPLFASVLYVSDPELFGQLAGRFARHLLLRHGVLATLAELRVVKRRPRRSVLLAKARPKMFRSQRLAADRVDNLYSELTCVAW
jgi:hypothetical protein